MDININEAMRIFLPIFGIIFFFSVFLLRTFIVWKNTGINAYVLLNQSGAYGTIGRYFKILPLFSTLVTCNIFILPI